MNNSFPNQKSFYNELKNLNDQIGAIFKLIDEDSSSLSSLNVQRNFSLLIFISTYLNLITDKKFDIQSLIEIFRNGNYYHFQQSQNSKLKKLFNFQEESISLITDTKPFKIIQKDLFSKISKQFTQILNKHTFYEILGLMYLIHLIEMDKITKNPSQRSYGVYYTPTWLVESLIVISIKAREEKENLLDLKVLDPSCGTGIFILTYLDMMYNEKRLSADQFTILLRDCIFGIDIDQLALNYLLISLKLFTISKFGSFITIPSDNIIHQDFCAFQTGSYDLILGNPPYISWYEIQNELIKSSKNFCELQYNGRPNHKDSQPNLYLFFIIKAISLLNKNGVISFLIPQEWQHQTKTKTFREFITERLNTTIYNFIAGLSLFTFEKSVGTTSSFFIGKMNGNKSVRIFSINKIPSEQSQNLVKMLDTVEIRNEGLVTGWIPYSTEIAKIKDLISTNEFVKLDNNQFFSVIGGFQPNIEKSIPFTLNSEERLNLLSEESNIFPIIFKSQEIKPFFIEDPQKYWIVLNDLFVDETALAKQCPYTYSLLDKRIESKVGKWWEFPNVRNMNLFKNTDTKIISPRTGKINSFAIDTNKRIIRGTNSVIVCKKLDPYYCTGILNSKLSNIWYDTFGQQYHGNKYKKFEPALIKRHSLPILNEESKVIIDTVKSIMNIKNTMSTNSKSEINDLKKDLSSLMDDLDKLVFEHYRIDPSSIKNLTK